MVRFTMDLRGLESTQWRGFSDREIQHYHSNTKKVSKAKLEVKGNVPKFQHQSVAAPEGGGMAIDDDLDPLKEDLHCDDSKPQLPNATDSSETKEVATPLPLETPTEADLAQPYVSTCMCEFFIPIWVFEATVAV